eukprot:9315187-Ditylum_brightwellii.AAC.1
MESDASLILTWRLFKEKGVAIEKIVADDGSSMKALLQHSYAEKLDGHNQFPNFTRTRTGNRQNKIVDNWASRYLSHNGWPTLHPRQKL